MILLSQTFNTRCGIPVIIMGDTGCGKTRLIKYMCDFTKQQKCLQNMFTMKVSQLYHVTSQLNTTRQNLCELTM